MQMYANLFFDMVDILRTLTRIYIYIYIYNVLHISYHVLLI